VMEVTARLGSGWQACTSAGSLTAAVLPTDAEGRREAEAP
jgi:hypothetical protein